MSNSKSYVTYETRSASPPNEIHSPDSHHNEAFQGLLKVQNHHPSQPMIVSNILEPSVNKICNPGPLGLFSFAVTSFVHGVYLTGAGYDDLVPQSTNAIFGLAFFMGGLAQFIAGMWELKVGNTFGGTVHSCYGAYWMAHTVLLIPAFEIEASYGGDVRAYSFAMGIYAMLWAFLSLIFILGALRTNIATLCTLTGLFLTFFFSGLTNFTVTLNSTVSLHLSKTTGAFAILAAVAGFYTGSAGLMIPEKTFIRVPVGILGNPIKDEECEEVRIESSNK